MSELLELAARAEAATGPDRGLDAEIHALLYPARQAAADENQPPPGFGAGFLSGSYWGTEYTSSLDGAMTLVPEGWQLDQLGEWLDIPLRALGPWLAVLISPQRPMNDGGSGGAGDPYVRCQHAATAALALTAAALRARAAEQVQP